MSQIERFRRRLKLTQKIIQERLGSIKGAEDIGDALEEGKRINDALGWIPKPEKPGTGTTGEATKRMSRGGKP